MPKGILPPAKMQDVFWDYMRADVFTTDFIAKDSAKNLALENIKLQKEVFEIHHISKEEFYNSYDYYLKNTAQMKILLDTMLARKNRDKYKNIQHLP